MIFQVGNLGNSEIASIAAGSAAFSLLLPTGLSDAGGFFSSAVLAHHVYRERAHSAPGLGDVHVGTELPHAGPTLFLEGGISHPLLELCTDPPRAGRSVLFSELSGCF